MKLCYKVCLSTRACGLTKCSCTEADLHIGELQWGDSGVYFCKVFSGDDLEGRNEGQLELLVLGESFSPQFSLEMLTQ